MRGCWPFKHMAGRDVGFESGTWQIGFWLSGQAECERRSRWHLRRKQFQLEALSAEKRRSFDQCLFTLSSFGLWGWSAVQLFTSEATVWRQLCEQLSFSLLPSLSLFPFFFEKLEHFCCRGELQLLMDPWQKPRLSGKKALQSNRLKCHHLLCFQNCERCCCCCYLSHPPDAFASHQSWIENPDLFFCFCFFLRGWGVKT